MRELVIVSIWYAKLRGHKTVRKTNEEHIRVNSAASVARHLKRYLERPDVIDRLEKGGEVGLYLMPEAEDGNE